MIGSGLKKLAKAYGMGVDKGVAYGNLGGYAATLSEGAGFKQIVFATTIADSVKLTELQTVLNGRNLKKEFRVTNLNIGPKAVQVIFHDDPGTMKKIYAFLDYFLPLLGTAGATGANICPECGFEITGGCWKLIDGTAFYLHQACADKVCREIASEEQTRREAAPGSYITGLIGAFIGAALGGVLWAVVMYFGYMASIVGLAIGWLAERGYALLKGKPGKGKIVVLILAVIFGVVLGNFGADVITLVSMINSGELYGMAYGDIPAMILYLLVEDPEYLSLTVRYILGGFFFAGLGVWGLLRRANAEVADTKIADLK